MKNGYKRRTRKGEEEVRRGNGSRDEILREVMDKNNEQDERG